MVFDREHFEKVFARADAWGYRTCEYERVKYRRQIDALKRYAGTPKNILEIGAAEGIHTLMLAEAFPGAVIVSVDFSHLAVERARNNCAARPNIRPLEADIVELLKKRGLPPRTFDIIVQSECLYYLFPRLAVTNLVGYFRDMARTLSQEGVFLTSNGMSPATRLVMGLYYLVLKRFCEPVHSATYREWNDVRNKRITYDLRVFRLKPGTGGEG